MIQGSIRATGTPVLQLRVIGKGTDIALEGILDTGFDGFVCLPIPIAVSLGLDLVDVTTSELADGTLVEDDLVFEGQVEWDGALRNAAVLLTRSDEALIGTSLLVGYRVQLDYVADTVEIERVADAGDSAD